MKGDTEMVEQDTIEDLARDIGAFMGHVYGMCNHQEDYLQFFRSAVKPGLVSQNQSRIRWACLNVCRHAAKVLEDAIERESSEQVQ